MESVLSQADGEVVIKIAAVKWWGLRITITAIVVSFAFLISHLLQPYIALSIGPIVSITLGTFALGIAVFYRSQYLTELLISDQSQLAESHPPLSESFSILCNRRRRMVLSYLNTNNGHVHLRDLAESIAAEENGISIRQLGSDQRQRVYIALYQTHLPRLQSAHAISYNENRGKVSITEKGANMYELFSLFEEQFAHRIDADSDGEIQNVFHAVRNTRRRYVVYYLQSLPDQTSDLSDLATQIAAWEEDCEPGDIEPETRKRVYVGCYQSHLPTLDEEGIVRYEKENGRVELTERGRILGEYLSLFEGEELFPLEDTDWARLN